VKGGQATVVGRINWKNQINDQKLKELLHLETQFAMCGRDARSVSKEKGNAAIYIQALRLVTNQWRVTTLQSHRDSKVMTWNRRKLRNRWFCFLFRIEGYEKLSASTSRRCRNPVVVEPPFRNAFVPPGLNLVQRALHHFK
jgi:hypothetical protein